MPPKADKTDPKVLQAEEEARAAEEAAARQTALVASTFANVELQSMRSTLSQYVSLYNASRAEVAKLTQELQDRDRDAMTVVQFLRNDLDQRQDQIKELRRKGADDLRELSEREEAAKTELRSVIADRDAEIGELNDKIDTLEANLAALEAFRRERDAMHHELAQLRSDHEAAVEKYEAELSKQRFLSLEEKVRLKAEERMMEQRFDTEVNDRAMKLLDSKTKEINAENFMLLSDKAALERELSRGNEAYATLRSKVNGQRRECELAALADAEHVKRSVTKSRAAKELQQRLQEVETSLAKTIREHKAEMAALSETNKREVAELVRERDEALRTAELIQRDFLKMRKLTRTVVQQRTELESFFIEALDYVRIEIDRERRQHHIAASKSGVLALPAITAGPAGRNSGATQQTPSNLPLITAGSGEPRRGAAAKAARAADRSRQSGVATTASMSGSQAEAVTASQRAFGPFFAEGNRFEALSGPRPPPQQQQTHGGTSGSVGSNAGPSANTPTGGDGGDAGASRGARRSEAGFTATGAEYHDPVSDHLAQLPTGDGRVDISELSWPDKERVLRILFSKLSAVGNGAPARQSASAAPSTAASGVVPRPAIDAPPRDSVFMTQRQ